MEIDDGLMRMRFRQFQDMIKLKTGQLDQSNKIKLHRKSIARIKTILNERDSGVSSNEN